MIFRLNIIVPFIFFNFLLINCENEVISQRELTVHYWETQNDTTSYVNEILIGDDKHQLTFELYSNNDSSLFFYDTIKKFKDFGHSSSIDIILKKDQNLLLKKTIDKKIFRDEMNPNFYAQCLLTGIDFRYVRSNRLYLTLYLCQAETDNCYAVDLAMFFRTSKEGRLDYLNYRPRDYGDL